MAIVKVEKTSYTVEPLYQWDLNQVLEITGLSLATVPEIHFTNTAMSRAIVRQATMDAAGVIRADIPNSMLQKPYTINAYVCTYEGDTFQSLYKIDIPVKARTQPADYELVDDPEVYSFNALENQVVNALYQMDVAVANMEQQVDGALDKADGVLSDANAKYAEANVTLDEAKATYEETMANIDELVAAATREEVGKLDAGDVNAYTKEESLATATKTLYGLEATAIPDDVLQAIKTLIATAQTSANNAQTSANAAQSTADGRARVATGTYVGNGKFGSGNKKSLSFNFPVQFFILHDGSNTLYTHYSGANGSNGINQQSYLLIPRLAAETDIKMYASGDPNYQIWNKFSFSGNTVSWYAYSSSEQYYPADAGDQFNTSGTTYYYIAIG